MKRFVFLANDPGGFDVVFPVAVELSKREDTSVKVMLTGQAAERQPLFKMTKPEILQYLKDGISSEVKFFLVTGTSWNSAVELEAVELCKNNGIKTASILDYWCNYKERFAYKGRYIFPDYYLVMDKLAFDEAAQEGIDASIMRIIGTPGLDSYVRKKKKTKRVLFISQPLSELYADGYDGYTEFEAFDGVIKACQELKISASIKFHPKETARMKSLYGHMSVEGQLEDIAFDYDAIIGMTTMGLLQCSLMGIPVISYEPNLDTKDKCIINKLEIVKGAYTYDDLLTQLKAVTGSVDEKTLPFWFDGESTGRCVRELLSIYEEGQV